MKPLVLRRDNARDPHHYQVFCGAVRIATILQPPNVVTGQWAWHLNGVRTGPIPLSGHAESLDGAKLAVRSAWDQWLAALDGEPPGP